MKPRHKKHGRKPRPQKPPEPMLAVAATLTAEWRAREKTILEYCRDEANKLLVLKGSTK